MNYWDKRITEAQEAISKKQLNQIQKQLRKYYRKASNTCIKEFEATYDKIMLAAKEGQQVTPADLYKLSRYWEAQNAMKSALQELGDKEQVLFLKEFAKEWEGIYYLLSQPSAEAFSTISTSGAQQAVNSIWCADGKHFSQRIWTNTEKLVESLNDEMVQCVITGKKTSELKQKLMERFNVSYNNANKIARTEIAHIQTQAAVQRYKDYGIEEYEFIGREEDDSDCECNALNGKRFKLSEGVVGVNMPPMHPNCRCCIAPVVNEL